MAKGRWKKWLKPEGLEQIAAWARDGLTDKELAKKMGISPSTLYEWEKRFPEILESLKINKELADARIEDALYRRACGCVVKKTTHEITIDKDGNKHVKTYETEEEVAPNPVAAIFWLKNRQPGKWKDKQEVSLNGDISVTDALRAARERAIKATEGNE